MTAFFKKISTTDIRNILATLYVTMVLVYIYVLVFKPVPDSNKDLINVIGGNVIGGLGIILGYYFGASKKDVTKDDKSE
jgi:hypothetical protein